jgi:hypothetical protein
MKRILTTLALLSAFALSASAQARKTEVQAVWISPDTGVLNTLPCNDSFDIEFLFINVGPETVTVNDTFYFQAPFTPSGQINYKATPTPVLAGDTIVHYQFRYKISQLKRLADATNTIVFPPFANDNYLMFAQAQGFYNAATPPAGYLEMDEDGEFAAGTAVKIDCGGTGIDNLFGGSKKQTLVTYPNPTTGKLAFKYNFENTAASVRITDIAGRVVMTQEFGKQSGVREISLDVASLNNGMYFLELTAGNNHAISKVTVQK